MSSDRSNGWSSDGVSGRWSGCRRRQHSFSEKISSETCQCGMPIVTKTSWTNTNPGRRFLGFGRSTGGYCDVFEWIDPPMCDRSVVIISGLLKKLNAYEKKTHYHVLEAEFNTTKELIALQHVWDTVVQYDRGLRIYVNLVDPSWDNLSLVFKRRNEVQAG
ncbi:UNVERIFIED_CONTAM: hypothetical protein Slati_0961800 [Sesamum latifolium]|uniref:Zinc finger GRF-type domain-containing protein n=1 Tax=Sesamum latifolium TaxID=2727402 RepID=A0AAW2XU07_9LAMI